MERFNPCVTDACTKQCDSMGVRCEEVCIDEIERLRAELKWIAEAVYSAPEVLRQVAHDALKVPNV